MFSISCKWLKSSISIEIRDINTIHMYLKAQKQLITIPSRSKSAARCNAWSNLTLMWLWYNFANNVAWSSSARLSFWYSSCDISVARHNIDRIAGNADSIAHEFAHGIAGLAHSIAHSIGHMDKAKGMCGVCGRKKQL